MKEVQMSDLDTKLTEEDKNEILSIIDRERKIKIINDYFEVTIDDPDEDVRVAAAQNMGVLAEVSSDLYSHIFRMGMTYPFLVKHVVGTLGSVAKNNPMYYRVLIRGQLRASSILYVLPTLESLAESDPQGYKETIHMITRKPDDLAANTPDDILFDTMRNIGKIPIDFSPLADIDPEEFVKQVEEAWDYPDPGPKMFAALSLTKMAEVNPDKYKELVTKGIEDTMLVRHPTFRCLGPLAKIDPEKYEELLGKAIAADYKDRKRININDSNIDSIIPLADINLEKFVKFMKEQVRVPDPGLKKGLEVLAEKSPEEYTYFVKYSVDSDIMRYGKIERYDLIYSSLAPLAKIDQNLLVYAIERRYASKIMVRDNPFGIESIHPLKGFLQITLLEIHEKYPEEFPDVVEKIMDKSEDKIVQIDAAEFIHLIADIDSEKYMELIEKIIADPLIRLRSKALGNLAPLADLDQAKYLESLSSLFSQDLSYVSTRNFLNSLVPLQQINPQLYESYVDQILPNIEFVDNYDIPGLKVLATVRRNYCEHLLEKSIEKRDLSMLEPLLLLFSELNLIEYEAAMHSKFQSHNKHKRISSIQMAAVLAKSINKERTFDCIDAEYESLKILIDKSNMNKDELSQYMNKLVYSNHINIAIMGQLVKAGLTFEDAEECSQVRIAGYEVIGKLGQGVFGSTYRAHSASLKNDRAVKIIDPEKVNPKEAELLSTLKGEELENIVQIFDAGHQIARYGGEEKYAVIMEYVDGKTLREAAEDGGMKVLQILDYSAQIFNGIKNLRGRNIVHRDLNSNNIKINSEGIIKILDFGIATDEEPEAVFNREEGAPKGLISIGIDIIALGFIIYTRAAGHNLVYSREGEEIGVQTYKNTIAELKQEMYTKNKLKDKYRERIKENVPTELHELIFTCLEQYEDIDAVPQSLEKSREDFKYYFMTKQELVDRIRELEKKESEL